MDWRSVSCGFVGALLGELVAYMWQRIGPSKQSAEVKPAEEIKLLHVHETKDYKRVDTINDYDPKNGEYVCFEQLPTREPMRSKKGKKFKKSYIKKSK